MRVCSFTIYFIDPDLRIEAFFQKDEAQQKLEAEGGWGEGGRGGDNFEIGAAK